MMARRRPTRSFHYLWFAVSGLLAGCATADQPGSPLPPGFARALGVERLDNGCFIASWKGTDGDTGQIICPFVDLPRKESQ